MHGGVLMWDTRFLVLQEKVRQGGSCLVCSRTPQIYKSMHVVICVMKRDLQLQMCILLCCSMWCLQYLHVAAYEAALVIDM